MTSNNFARSLSLLRQEKGVSQRVAAQKLGVSQALLSHYENGIREPGLNFVLRACVYYNVSADFLLGRTLSREGTVLNVESLSRASEADETAVSSDNLALRSTQLLVTSADLLLNLLAKTDNKDAIRSACNYLGTAVYILFRHLYQAQSKNNSDMFSVSSQHFALSAADVDMLSSKLEFVDAITAHAKNKGHFPDLSHEALSREYADLYQSLLHIIHLTGERINSHIDHRKEAGIPYI